MSDHQDRQSESLVEALKQKSDTTKGPRSYARLVAVQAVYQHFLTEDGLEKLLGDFSKDTMEVQGLSKKNVDWKFFKTLMEGLLSTQADYKTAINGCLRDGWSYERLDRVVMSILNLGAFELLEHPKTPEAVIISEYVDIAKAFFGSDEPKFVHGVLDALKTKLRT